MIECAAAPGNRRKGIPARTREEESPSLPSSSYPPEGESRGAFDVWGVARVRMGKRITIAEEQDAFIERSADEGPHSLFNGKRPVNRYRLLHDGDT